MKTSEERLAYWKSLKEELLEQLEQVEKNISTLEKQ